MEEPFETKIEAELDVALGVAADESIPAAERAEMLMELAMALQVRPRSGRHLAAAIAFYGRALELCGQADPLLSARILARRGTALEAMPDEGMEALHAARRDFEAAAPVLAALGGAEEIAEAEMNLGLVIQSLAGLGEAAIVDAIAAYQRALRTFDRRRFPVEFAILQNNLATAFLSVPLYDERGQMREALAIQAFEDGLKLVTLVDHPVEYAMLQNNLGNALQYAPSSHAVENNLRALAAYDEALRVRRRETMPLEYANTIANRANCLGNLPDDPERPEDGNRGNLARALADYQEAGEIFTAHGDAARAQAVAEAVAELAGDSMPAE